nr:hypothetical protein [Tanacetum cinerariifolium]
MLMWQNDDTKRMVTCQLPKTEFVTDEMLTWQNKEEEELSKFLDEMLTSSAYVTINGNKEPCGSYFYDSDTSYMAGISGA